MKYTISDKLNNCNDCLKYWAIKYQRKFNFPIIDLFTCKRGNHYFLSGMMFKIKQRWFKSILIWSLWMEHIITLLEFKWTGMLPAIRHEI